MVRSIEILAVIGVLVLASCAKPPGTPQKSSELLVDAGVRSPHDVLAMLTQFTGGLTMGSSATIRGVYATNQSSLPWVGGMGVGSIKAFKEMVAVFCQVAGQSNVYRPILFPGFDRTIAPRNASGALAHPANVRLAVVENLLLRSTGMVPTAEETAVVATTFEDLLRLVNNNAAGTALAMDSICTVVASSALSGFAY